MRNADAIRGRILRTVIAALTVSGMGAVGTASIFAAEPTTGSNTAAGTAAETMSGAASGAMAGTMPAGTSDPYRGYQNDYPAAEVQAVPVARAESARARVILELTRERLYRYIDRSWDDFYNSKDYLDAAAAQSRAQQNYDRERDRVMRTLSNDASYRALTDLVKTMHEKLDRDRPKGSKPSQDEFDQIVATASVKLGYSSTASSMEAAALAADSGVQDARNRLVDAGNRKVELRRTQDRQVRRSDEFASGRNALDQARLNRTVAEAFEVGAVEARNIAISYATYLHGWDQYRYSTTGAFGYGYGYGYPAYNTPAGYGGGGVYGAGYQRRY